MFTFLQGFSQSDTEQKKQDQYNHLRNQIESRKFRFHALSATSMKGMTRQLTSDYFLKLDNDNLSVDLPYYGRSFTTNYPPTDLSTEFKTTQFSYQSDTLKKGGWDITIVPKNESNASKINLSITASGYCTVRISSNAREPISYYGTITDYDAK
ncbi:MAG TPA: DUF4251 domain-containing protein [Bacteroidia bacterium]|nr:DUF4251 domain-containing protein [Bacteroidia bacterium]